MLKRNQTRLRADVIQKIKSDPDLAAGVVKKLNVEFSALHMYLQRNSRRLTEYPVLSYLSEQLKIEMPNLVCETNVELIA